MPERICQVTTSERSRSSFPSSPHPCSSLTVPSLSIPPSCFSFNFLLRRISCLSPNFLFCSVSLEEFYEQRIWRVPKQCKAYVRQEEGERGRRASSSAAGRLAPELLRTFSRNVISNMSNARLNCNCSIYSCCGCLEAARLPYLLWRLNYQL